MPSRRHGILFVLSGPSGAGKSTLLESLGKDSDFAYSVSCTTRAPRPGEVNGRDYHFMSEAEFRIRLEKNEFIEHAQVHGHFYGTLFSSVMPNLEAGLDTLLDIDIQGARKIREFDDGFFVRNPYLADVFITPQSIETLHQRLMKRGTETPGALALRLKNAAEEMRCWREYRYTVLSTTPEQDYLEFRAIMQAERCRSSRLNLETEHG